MKKEDRIKVWEKYDHHCAYCGREIKLEDMQIDHFIPKNRGNYSRWSDKEGKYIVSHGEDSMENYMPSCRACNFRKRDMSIGQFREAIKEQAKGFLLTLLYYLIKKKGRIFDFLIEKSTILKNIGFHR